MDDKPRLVIEGGVLALLLVGAAAWWFFTRTPEVSPEELARQALEAQGPEKQEAAAAELAKHGKKAKPLMQDVLKKSQNPGVRVAMMTGLAAIWDYDDIDVFMAGLQDESPVIRQGAAGAMSRLLDTDMRTGPAVAKTDQGARANGVLDYGAYDPPERRAVAVQRVQRYWEFFKQDKLQRWIKKLEAKGQL
jgi:hypothetical protein